MIVLFLALSYECEPAYGSYMGIWFIISMGLPIKRLFTEQTHTHNHYPFSWICRHVNVEVKWATGNRQSHRHHCRQAGLDSKFHYNVKLFEIFWFFHCTHLKRITTTNQCDLKQIFEIGHALRFGSLSSAVRWCRIFFLLFGNWVFWPTQPTHTVFATL